MKLLFLITVTLCLVIPADAKHRRKRQHVTAQQIEAYCRNQGAGVGICKPKLSPCQEFVLANPGIRFLATKDELLAIKEQIPLIQEGELALQPPNVNPCK